MARRLWLESRWADRCRQCLSFMVGRLRNLVLWATAARPRLRAWLPPQPAAKPKNLNMSLMLAGELDEEVGLEHSTNLLRALAQVGLAARPPFLLL